jgi:hypothetical protein
MRIAALFIFTFFTCLAFSQIIYEFDTLTYESRMGEIDSIDVSGRDQATTFDGGIAALSPSGLSSGSLYSSYTTPVFMEPLSWGTMEFSALPHLGFSYSFGGQGSQYLRAKYNHALSDKMLLDLNYDRNVGVGYIRNGGFTHNNVRLQFQRIGLRYTIQLKAGFQSNDVSHPAGLHTDTLIEDFGLEFSPVNKENARSLNKAGSVFLKNYFNFLSDSSVMLGVTTIHKYSIKNRLYTESDTLYGIYSNVFIDSFATRDQYNVAKILNGAGVYFSSDKFYIDGVLDYAYWDYQNLTLHQDTSEIGIGSNLALNINAFKIENYMHFNLAGAFNEFSEKVSLCFEKNIFSVNGFLNIQSTAPVPVQRKYFSNNANYAMTSIKKQNTLQSGGIIDLEFLNKKIVVSGFGDFTSISDLLYFNGNNWINDTVLRNFTSLGACAAFEFGVFNFHPRIVYSFDSDGYLPDYQLYGRLFVKGRLFKAKKLEALLGCDVSYISSYRTKSYIPSMDTYNWYATSTAFDPMLNMHAFVTLGIEEFRFYFRFENIGYYWADKRNQIVSNYPLPGTRMSLGFTWDFFN